MKVGKRVTIEYTDPKIRYILLGRRVGPMRWLRKAMRPIPIETPQGMVFRWATSRSLANGSWVHPGSHPYDLRSKLMERLVPIFKSEIKSAVAAQLRAHLLGK